MTLPLYDSGVASGLLSGMLFGYVLENAGFGSPRKLTAQFRFSDWSVFKVMFTAIVVAAIGLYVATAFGWMKAGSIFIPTTYFWATLTGGALVGAGMAIGGYCPGTSSVAVAAGRLDGLFFIVGMVLGTALFAGVFDRIEGFYSAAAGPVSQTLPELFGIPEWLVLVALVVLAVLGFVAGTMLERLYGGPLSAAQVETEGEIASVTEIEIVEITAG
ncbi:MAG: YeeE/YedE family protein [Rhodopseudomonas sp.]|nr:YeeE/YedE family protein [Rhodopseudomonas sp.]